LSQTDRMSAFVDAEIKIFLTPSLITMQNLVVVSHTVCVHMGCTKNSGGCWAPPPWDTGVPDP